MKKVPYTIARPIILIILLLGIDTASAQVLPLPYAPTTSLNYVRSWDAKIPISDAGTMATRPVTEVQQTTAYVDGLGRPIQTVVKQGALLNHMQTTTYNDMVSPVFYDEQGLETLKFLPFGSATTDGGFKYDAFQQQKSFYDAQLSGQGDTYYYSKTDVEFSPLNRPTKNYPPGNSWVASNRGVATSYLNNTAAEGIKVWTVNGTGNYTAGSQPYGDGQLVKTISTDENGNQVVEYKDKEGKVILKKVQVGTSTASNFSDWLYTYYVYDIYNNLRLVIQPKGVAQLNTNGWIMNSTIMDELCFRYEYDDKNRMSIKKVPGAAEVYMIYDKWDRLVLTQDGNMRNDNKWVFTKYDNLNRPVMTGFYVDNSHIGQVSMQTYVTGLMNASGRYEDRNSSTIGYTITSSFPALSNPDLLTISFYDDYTWCSNYNNTYANRDNTNDALFYSTGSSPLYAQPLTQSNKTKGLPTGTVTYVLNSSTNQKLVSSVFYDDRGRAIQSKAGNITGGIDITTTQYDFSGKPLLSLLRHEKASSPNAQTVNVLTRMEYDALGRVLSIKKKVTQTMGGNTIPASATEKTIVKNEYNLQGQLANKTLAPEFNSNAGLEQLSYDYNIRGWMTGVNRNYLSGNSSSNYFGMELAYDKTNTVAPGASYVAAQFNGNIAGTSWKTKGDVVNRQYDFDYDKVNRLLRADFRELKSNGWTALGQGDFDVMMGLNGHDYSSAYDENGNIKRMQQKGLKINQGAPIDDLTYTYANGGLSNKLVKVADAINDPASKLGDFKDGTNTGDDYTYDVNGNMNIDRNKGIIDDGVITGPGIIYNHLNLPMFIKLTPPANSVNGSRNITYSYDAAGNKLSKIVSESQTPGSNRTITTSYIAGLVYETKITNQGGSPEPDDHTDLLQFVGHEEGRIRYKPAIVDANGNIITPADFTYDYFIKDHLGNVRMVLTDETRQDIYPAATLEPALNGTENSFYTIDQSKIRPNSEAVGIQNQLYPNNNGIFNNNPSCSGNLCTTANSQYLYKLNANTNKTGLGITLKVMAGDKLDIFGKSYYFQNSPGSSSNSSIPILDLLTGLLGSPSASASLNTHGVVSPSQINTTEGVSGINTMFSNQTSQSNANQYVPKAFINYLFFDEQFKCVGSGFSQVGSNSVVKDHYTFNNVFHGIEAPKNGFVYIYCSNESPVDVFFDNIQVVHTRSQMLEETDYYPFGMTMAGISSKAVGVLENRKKYNGIELDEDLGLNTYEADLRDLDPQTGRWWQIDPKVDAMYEWSTYASNFDNPIRYKDPLGDEPNGECCGDLWNAIKETGNKIMISASGALWGSLNTATGGLVSTDPFNVRPGLNAEEKMYWDNAVTVGQVSSLLPVPGHSAPVERPLELVPAGGGRGNVTIKPGTVEVPTLSTNQVKGQQNVVPIANKKDRVANQKSGERALNQKEGIEQAKEKAKKTAPPGEKQNKIYSDKKSEQNLNKQLKDVKSLKDAIDKF